MAPRTPPAALAALAIGRLLRLSLLPSALADVAVGIVLGSRGEWPRGAAPWLAMGASLGVYHGALALNDWADRASDARTRPDRPIPSGAVSEGAALSLALGLVAAGVASAFAVALPAGLWMGGVALAAVFYDLAGRGPWIGPALLGLCRYGNFAFGLCVPAWLAGAHPEPSRLAPAVLYGGYVFCVSRLARLEDDEDPRPLGQRPRHYLLAALACLVLVPFLPLADPGFSPGFLAALAAVVVGGRGLLQAALGTREWTRARVGQCTGMGLRRLLVFTAACALLGLGWGPAPPIVAGLALAGYPASFALRRVFPPS